MTHSKTLVRPTTDTEEMGKSEVGKVLLGMGSDEEPEDVEEELEPEEAVEALRKRIEPLPSEEEQRKHRITRAIRTRLLAKSSLQGRLPTQRMSSSTAEGSR